MKHFLYKKGFNPEIQILYDTPTPAAVGNVQRDQF